MTPAETLVVLAFLVGVAIALVNVLLVSRRIARAEHEHEARVVAYEQHCREVDAQHAAGGPYMPYGPRPRR